MPAPVVGASMVVSAGTWNSAGGLSSVIAPKRPLGSIAAMRTSPFSATRTKPSGFSLQIRENEVLTRHCQ